MILVVTNRQDYTADFLLLEMRQRRVDYIRFNTEDFPQRVKVIWQLNNSGLDGYFLFPKARISFSEITSIWYRRPVSPIPSPKIQDTVAYGFAVVESQAALDNIWRSLNCFWVSDPDCLRKAEYKLYQLKVASQIGFQISPTLVTNDSGRVGSFYEDCNRMMVYKPLKNSKLLHDDSVSLIYTNFLEPSLMKQVQNVQLAPSLFQEYVPKEIEIRATVIGTKVFAVGIHSQDHEDSRHDWRRVDPQHLHHSLHQLPTDIEDKCVTLVKTMGLEFGAIDLIMTPRGEYVFLEINPNGQWAWIQQLCPDVPLRETLTDLLIDGSSENHAHSAINH